MRLVPVFQLGMLETVQVSPCQLLHNASRRHLPPAFQLSEWPSLLLPFLIVSLKFPALQSKSGGDPGGQNARRALQGWKFERDNEEAVVERATVPRGDPCSEGQTSLAGVVHKDT